MTARKRWSHRTSAFAFLLLSSGLGGNHALAGWPFHKASTAYPAPYVLAAPAPVAYMVQAPVAYAPAPMPYAAPAPYPWGGQVPLMYPAPAPVAYAGQAPAPSPYSTIPWTEQVRISPAVRNALYADLVAYYHSEESGTSRVEKIKAVREQARSQYEELIGDEDTPGLNASEREDLRILVDWVITGGPPNGQRAGYPQAGPPGAAGYGPAGYAPGPSPGGGVPVASQPAPARGFHLFHKH